MRQVTKDKFFAELFKRDEDIMPRIEGPFPYKSEWRNQDTRVLFGVSQDRVVGGLIEKDYWLV